MERRESPRERVKRMLKGFFQKEKPREMPETREQIRHESGKDIKTNIGDFASDLNLPESLDIFLPVSEDNPNETRNIRYFPQSEDLFLVETVFAENVEPTITKLEDENWVDYGPIVLNALLDIKNTLNPPQENK